MMPRNWYGVQILCGVADRSVREHVRMQWEREKALVRMPSVPLKQPPLSCFVHFRLVHCFLTQEEACSVVQTGIKNNSEEHKFLKQYI